VQDAEDQPPHVSRIFRGNYEGALSHMRTIVKNRNGLDLYLVGDEVNWNQAPDERRIRLFDAITGYTMYSDLQPAGWPEQTGFLASARTTNTAFKRAAVAHGVRFIPNVQPGFNDRGVRLPANHYVLPTELSHLATAARCHQLERMARGHTDRADRPRSPECGAAHLHRGVFVLVVRAGPTRVPRCIQELLAQTVLAAATRS
jgi:hypothetical protein